jgi:Rrf2 family protein
MRLQAKIRYAIRILVEVGKNQDKPLSLAEVEKRQHISAKFARQIIQPLEDKKIVGSQRGMKGGYFLKKKALKISLLSVIEALSEKIKVAPCLERPGICRREDICGAKIKWEELQGLIENFFAKTTIQDMIDREKE